MLGRLRLFLIIGLVMLPLTSASAQWQGSAQINLWALPYCDPVVNTRYDFGRPVGSVCPGRWRDMHVGPLFFVAEAEAAEVQLSRLGLARLT